MRVLLATRHHYFSSVCLAPLHWYSRTATNDDSGPTLWPSHRDYKFVHVFNSICLRLPDYVFAHQQNVIHVVTSCAPTGFTHVGLLSGL